MNYTSLILGDNWQPDEWPEHVAVSHQRSAAPARRYVPERTCRFALEEDRDAKAERAKIKPGEWTTRDIPLAWTCGACGEQYAPVAPFPAWIKHCPECGARVTEVA